MSKYNGFVMLRRGLFEHLSTGQLSPTECLIFTMLLSAASSASGVVSSCAEALSWDSGRAIPMRSCQDALSSLERKGYIKRFRLKGKHGNYPILVDNYHVTNGKHQGKRVNAQGSKSVAEVAYEKENLRTEENGESPLTTNTSGLSQEAVRTEPSMECSTDYRMDSSTLTTTNNSITNKESESEGPGASQEGTKTPVESADVLKLIEACYGLAEKPVVASTKSKAIAVQLLTTNSLPHLLALLDWCRSDSFWKERFRESKYPVNRFNKGLASITEQASAERPTKRKPVSAVKTTTATSCSRCEGRGTLFSTILNADLPCVCQKAA